MPSGRRGRVAPGSSLLDAARNLGVEIESICGGRLTCGKCKVRIEDGVFQKHGITSGQGHVSPPTKEELELLQNMGSEDCRLSCVAYIQGDVLAFVPEESRAQKQIIRKSATERVIEVAPAIRKVYIKVDEAQLGDHRATGAGCRMRCGNSGRSRPRPSTCWPCAGYKRRCATANGR
jgi:uncharacterized 2Fe-2S/4Fe-4S cluster protein (DUF4445 family)